MRLRSAICCAALWLTGLPALAATAIYEIQVSPAIYLEATLSHDVYRYARDAQLRDLLLQDRDGAELPFRIISRRPQMEQQSERFALPLFPVRAGTAANLNPQTLLRIEEDSITVSRNGERLGTGESGAAIDFYILDFSELRDYPQALEVTWQSENNETLQVEVSGSADLQNWRSLGRHTLAQLNRDNAQLLRNEIALGGRHPYLRLRILNQKNIELSAVAGLRKSQRALGPEPERWQLQGSLADNQRPALRRGLQSQADAVAAWEFVRDELAPVDQLAVELGSVSYADHIKLYSRTNEKQDWRLLHSGVWFNAQLGDTWQRSEALAIPPTQDRYWRLELSKSVREQADPMLVFQHPQQALQFIANHKPPYRLMLRDEPRSPLASAEVVSALIGERTIDWQPVELTALGAAAVLAERDSFAWRDLLFWLTLLFSVLLLLGFALRLYRQMEKQA